MKTKRGWRRYFGPKRAIILLLMAGCVAGGWYLREQGLLQPSLGFALIGEQAGTYLVEGGTADTVRTVLLVSAAITALVAIRIFAHYLDARSPR